MFPRQVKTSDLGHFNFLSLPPMGTPLRRSTKVFGGGRKAPPLAVGQRTELDMAMEIGSVNEQVTVAAEGGAR